MLTSREVYRGYRQKDNRAVRQTKVGDLYGTCADNKQSPSPQFPLRADQSWEVLYLELCGSGANKTGAKKISQDYTKLEVT